MTPQACRLVWHQESLSSYFAYWLNHELFILGVNAKPIGSSWVGDGSVNQGIFHEAMNMASLFELPLLVVVENNLYGEFTALEKHSAEPNLQKRLNAYRIPARRLDGNDAGKLWGEMADTINQVRKDGRPRMVELMTYRHHGHMEGESELYRPLEEKEAYLGWDPILLHQKRLLDQKMATEQEIKDLENKMMPDPGRIVESILKQFE